MERDGIDLSANRISPLVARHVPAFMREMYPKFITLLEKYYEFVEQSGEAVWATKKLLDFQDVDLTEDKFLIQFHKELASTVPFGLVVDKRLLYKNIIQYHRARGTEKSYELLFRILFNDRVTFYYPNRDIFKLSDGIWIVNKTIRVLNSTGDPFRFLDHKIEGRGSGTEAVVERVLKYQVGPSPVYELFLNNKSIEGEGFQAGEIVQTADESIQAIIHTCVVGFDITNDGEGYEEGDDITVSGGTGAGARFKVGSVGSNGEVKRIDIIDPGVNYATVPALTFGTTSDTATATAVKGALITYPGFWLNENGFLSSSKYLQDSYFYQQFSYVLQANESINTYKEIVKKALHPAGLILFGSVFADSLVREGTRVVPHVGGNSLVGKKIFLPLISNTNTLIETRTTTVVNINPPGEDSVQHGPTLRWLDRFKYMALPRDPRFDVGRKVPYCTLWVKSNSRVVRDSENRVLAWRNLVPGAGPSDGFQEAPSEGEMPLITREDNLENFIKWSNRFSIGDWVLSGVTGEDHATFDFNNIEKAAQLTCVAGASAKQMYQSAGDGNSFGETDVTLRMSLDVKKESGNDAQYVWIGDGGDSVAHSATFDLDDDAAEVGTTNCSTEVEDIGNGWFRVSIIFTRTTRGDVIPGVAINSTGHSDTPESWTAVGDEIINISRFQCRTTDADSDYLETNGGPEIRGYNGRPLIRFDGKDDFLETAETLADLGLEDDLTIYIAFLLRTPITAGGSTITNESVFQDSNQKLGLFVTPDPYLRGWNDDGSGDTVFSDFGTTVQTFHVAKLSHKDGQLKLDFNDTYAETSASSGDTADMTGVLQLAKSFAASGEGGSFFPEGFFPHGFAGEGFTGSGTSAFGKISVGEIIVCRTPSAGMNQRILDYLKKEWLDINYRRPEHWMAPPNEDYWDNYANMQVGQMTDLTIQEIMEHPRRKTNKTFPSYTVCREVISDIEEIKFDLNPQYQVLHNLGEDNDISWIKDTRRNIKRFEGFSGYTLPSAVFYTAEDADFNGMPSLTGDDDIDVPGLKSFSPSSEVVAVDTLIGRVVFRTDDVSQSMAAIIGDEFADASWCLYLDSGDINFSVTDSGGTKTVSVPIAINTTYLVAFQLLNGDLSIEIYGGASDTVSCGDIDSFGIGITMFQANTFNAFNGKIARLIIANADFDTTTMDSILARKYGLS